MKKEVILSIVIPVYNVEKYLRNCIDSVIKAYKENTEIILVDDGSTDNCGPICDEYAQNYEYISVIHRENGGLSAARNSGIRVATGNYIAFLDSDDYIEKDSIERIFNAIKENKDIIMCNFTKIYSDGTKSTYQPFSKDDDFNILPYKYFSGLGNISYTAWRFVVKSKLIKDNNLFFIEGIYHEDEEWTPRMLCVAKSFTVITEPIYNYRVGNPNSIIGMLNSKKVLDKIFISQSIYNRINREGITGDKKEFLQQRVVDNYIAALHECCRYKGNEKKKLIAELKKNKYLLDNITSKKAKLVRYSINTMGILITAKLLVMRVKLSKDS